MLERGSWITPIPDDRVLAIDADPAEIAAQRETIRLAFVAALQHLPSRQRAVLVLCEVLRWPARDVAELLDTSVAAVNSALQRARATMATVEPAPAAGALDAPARALLDRYVDAFERFDLDDLVTLLAEDAIQTMPPFAMWLRGRDDVVAWMRGPGAECLGSRLLPTAASGSPAFGQYRRDPHGGHAPWALQVLEVADDRIVAIHSFLDADAFADFGLPRHLPPQRG